MKVVEVIFEDGFSYVTKINGTEEEIEQYFLNHTFNVGTVSDCMKKCVEIKFLSNK